MNKRKLLFVLVLCVGIITSGCAITSLEDSEEYIAVVSSNPAYEFSYDKEEKIVKLKYYTSVNINKQKQESSSTSDSSFSLDTYAVNWQPYLDDLNESLAVGDAKQEKAEIVNSVDKIYNDIIAFYEISDVVCKVMYPDTKELQGEYSVVDSWR